MTMMTIMHGLVGYKHILYGLSLSHSLTYLSLLLTRPTKPLTYTRSIIIIAIPPFWHSRSLSHLIRFSLPIFKNKSHKQEKTDQEKCATFSRTYNKKQKLREFSPRFFFLFFLSFSTLLASYIKWDTEKFFFFHSPVNTYHCEWVWYT